MALRRRRGGQGNGLDAWPGYVDALSTLLMVIIFVLLVFVLAQAFLSVALSGRDQALDRINRQLSDLSDLLALEKGRSTELGQSVAQLSADLQRTRTDRDSLGKQISALKLSGENLTAERNSIRAERDRLAAQLSDAQAVQKSTAARIAELQAQQSDAASRTDQAGQQALSIAGQLAEAKRQMAELARVNAELNRTVTADSATIQARLGDLAKLNEQTQALAALRDDLERKAQDAAARAVTEQQRREAVEATLSQEKKLGDSARAQIALLDQQVTGLRAQMARLARDLDLANTATADKDTQIADLGQKLNAALAAKVEELQKYRSEFFGRLRDVMAKRPGVQVVGDRFVFQSEVLFPAGSADLTPAGLEQLRTLAVTIKDIARDIPKSLNWILRVDGHADRQKVTTGPFASNWELSTQRAVNVVKQLLADGVPRKNLAAAGFADTQPIDPGETPEAYSRNRRIEMRLTDR